MKIAISLIAILTIVLASAIAWSLHPIKWGLMISNSSGSTLTVTSISLEDELNKLDPALVIKAKTRSFQSAGTGRAKGPRKVERITFSVSIDQNLVESTCFVNPPRPPEDRCDVLVVDFLTAADVRCACDSINVS